MKESEASELMARLASRTIMSLFTVFVAASVQAFRHGLWPYVLLLVGSIISGITLCIYAGLSLSIAQNKEKTWLVIPAALCGILPYLFGCYLCFYEGFWRLRHLLDGFSFLLIFKSCFFIITGYATVHGTYLVSKMIRKISERSVSIE